jgi:hypothetical protein
MLSRNNVLLAGAGSIQHGQTTTVTGVGAGSLTRGSIIDNLDLKTLIAIGDRSTLINIRKRKGYEDELRERIDQIVKIGNQGDGKGGSLIEHDRRALVAKMLKSRTNLNPSVYYNVMDKLINAPSVTMADRTKSIIDKI